MKQENQSKQTLWLMILCTLLLCIILLSLCSCSNSSASPATEQVKPPAAGQEEPPTDERPKETQEKDMVKIQIAVDGEIFSVALYDNPSAQAFMKEMPLSITMEDLNDNEKFHYLAEPLPTDPQNLSEVKSGDLLLYGSDCLVLFYEDFSTSYSYTHLGYVEDAARLSHALGSGNVQVKFSLE